MIGECGADARPAPTSTPPLDVALRELELGVRELSDANDGVPSEKYMRGRREPWCAHFVAYCFREAGFRLPGDRWEKVRPGSGGEQPIASVKHLFDVLEERGALVSIDDVQPGDLIEWPTRGNSDRGQGRHVDFFIERRGTLWVVVGGNWKDAVSKRTVSIAVNGLPSRIARWREEAK